MCRPQRSNKTRTSTLRPRRGLTLVELMVASLVMALIAATVSVLASSAQLANDQTGGDGLASQHARVVINRIEQTMLAATATEEFPGFASFHEAIAEWQLPHWLVVWSPDPALPDTDGVPQFSEIVVYTPDPSAPHRLLEVTNRTDEREVPPFTDSILWRTEIENMIKAGSSVVLTDLVRTASDGTLTRGLVRFITRVHPTTSEWQTYISAPTDANWSSMSWPQDLYSVNGGIRQSWCRIELQLMPGPGSPDEDPTGQTAIPFFGSAALYYQVERP